MSEKKRDNKRQNKDGGAANESKEAFYCVGEREEMKAQGARQIKYGSVEAIERDFIPHLNKFWVLGPGQQVYEVHRKNGGKYAILKCDVCRKF